MCNRRIIFGVSLFWVCSFLGASVADLEARDLRPAPGIASFEVRAEEVVDLYVNLTPRAGDIPRREWLAAMSSRSEGIYLVTGGGVVPFRPGMNLNAATYPYAHPGENELICSLSLQASGLDQAGDSLVYAYAYAVADTDQIVVDNAVIVSVGNQSPALSAFASEGDLAAYLKEGLRRNAFAGGRYVAYDSGGGPPGVFGGSAPEAAAFSTTNLQEAGVDEADLMKSDGRFLYLAPRSQPGIYYLAADGGGAPVPAADDGGSIRILELSADPPRALQVGVIDLTAHTLGVDDLYLVKNRGPGQSDLLVTLGGRRSDIWYYWADPWYWGGNTVEIALYNVDDPSEAHAVSRITLDGQLVASRRIGDMLYLVTRFTPTPPGFTTYPADEADEQANEAVLGGAALSDLLPRFSVNGTVAGSLVRPENCYAVPAGEELVPQPTLITVTAMPLSAPEQHVSRTIAGPTETVYAATEALYLATTRQTYLGPGGAPVPLVREQDVPAQRPPVITDLHKFALTPQGPDYRGSGSVQGHLGWETDKRPFRLSDHEGVLRVATSLGETWDDTAATRLSLLDENPGIGTAALRELAHIDGIGKTGERLYAARFAGPRCYLVTFRVTDPLYVFDLSDPRNPRQLGELHIDGYSDYLHPIGTDLLLGVGKDAIPSSAASDFGGRGAWYQGVKLALFDVSDPANPQEVDTLVIGKRGTDSDALYDHHAFTYLPPTADGPARLALPVRLHDSTPTYPGFDPAEPWSYYEWTHTGLYLFELYTGRQDGRGPSIVQTGEMVVASRSTGADADWSWGGWSDRAVIVDDSVHYVHNGNVWSAFWGSGDQMTVPQ